MLFHFQQALFRKMLKLGIERSEASIGCGMIKELTTINLNNVESKIEELEKNYLEQTGNWGLFWRYFKNVWIKRFPPALWNIGGIDTNQCMGRTNNYLERYNRRIGEKFINSHPNIYAFVSVIQEEEEYYSNLCRGIRSGIIPMETDFEN